MPARSVRLLPRLLACPACLLCPPSWRKGRGKRGKRGRQRNQVNRPAQQQQLQQQSHQLQKHQQRQLRQAAALAAAPACLVACPACLLACLLGRQGRQGGQGNQGKARQACLLVDLPGSATGNPLRLLPGLGPSCCGLCRPSPPPPWGPWPHRQEAGAGQLARVDLQPGAHVPLVGPCDPCHAPWASPQ